MSTPPQLPGPAAVPVQPGSSVAAQLANHDDSRKLNGGDQHRVSASHPHATDASKSDANNSNSNHNHAANAPPPLPSRSPSLSTGSSQLFITPPPAPTSIRAGKEISRLNEVISESSNEALQAVLRENWQRFLFGEEPETSGTDAHLTFLLQATIANAKFKNVGDVANLVTGLGRENPGLMENVLRDLLQNVPVERLASLVPSAALDRILQRRIEIASARDLVSWLGQAGRLGFGLDDILDDEDESVQPRMSRPGSWGRADEDAVMTDEVQILPGPPPRAVPMTDPLLAEQERNLALSREQMHRIPQEVPVPVVAPPLMLRSQLSQGPLVCWRCHFRFPTQTGYNFHQLKKLCEKPTPLEGYKFSCAECAKGFTTKQGLLYHQMNRVCQGEEIAPATSSPSQQQQKVPSVATPLARSENGPILSPQVPTAKTQRQEIHPISRPPLHTPKQVFHITKFTGPQLQSKVPKDDVRQSPSDLPAAKRAELDKALDDCEARFQRNVNEVNNDNTLTPMARAAKIVSLKNGNASRKSQIRKNFGVTLRLRTKDKEAQLENLQVNTAALRNTGPSGPASTSSPAYMNRPPSGFTPLNRPQISRPTFSTGQGPSSTTGMRRPRQGDMNNPQNTISTPDNYIHPKANFKRQRTSEESPAAATHPMAGPKRVPVSVAQEKWEALQPKNKAVESEGSEDRIMTDAPAKAVQALQARGAPSQRPVVITILSSDESNQEERNGARANSSDDDEDIPAYVPSMAGSGGSRGGKGMVKRGGRGRGHG